MIVRRITFLPQARSWPATCWARDTSPESAWPSAPRSVASQARRPHVMSSLEAIPAELIDEGRRMASICNACRYCEGYCAVFPALERRLTFNEADVNYLANLCHNCAECYYACQYAPPHECAVNVPKVFAEVRARSYRRYA